MGEVKMGGHIPVLLKEVMDALAVRPGGRYVDGTLGRAGHTKEIIARGGMVLGIDRDEQAIREIGEVAGLTAVRGRHGDLKEIANEKGWSEVDGILLDLGVSSPQLDEAGRGFSFLREGPLDMRMDRSSGFREYGEEPHARRIAQAIAAERRPRPFRTTTDLAHFVERVVGKRGSRHPATRVFQALRMEVNDEMGELERALEGGLELLKSGGRFAVITFESLTDRMVKRFFARHVGKMVSLQQGGERWEGETPKMRAVTGKVVVASEEESDLNPRSRSAKLRVAEKE